MKLTPFIVFAALIVPLRAQIGISDLTNPFRDFDARQSASAAADDKLEYKLPPALPIDPKLRPLILRPQRPILVLEGPNRTAPELTRIDRDRRQVVQELMRQRKTGNSQAAMHLLRRLDELRQERLAFMRRRAVKKMPTKTEGESSPSILPKPKPVLPMPKGPGGR
ncbi:MAG TPA: hypothetical protein ENK43_05370 [Planctomycetes bacterium]|nr:hypothetical protein [Planctomycetota bacterium]